MTDTDTYDAFGNLIAQTGTTPNVYLYAGEQLDVNTGYYYLRARFVNQALGRFLTTDPVSGSAYDPVSLHKYLYAHANPVSNTDPTGLLTLAEINVSLGASSILRNIELIQRGWQLSFPVVAKKKLEAVETAAFWGALATIIPLQLSVGIVPGFKYKVETIGRESYFELEKPNNLTEVLINFSYKQAKRFTARIDYSNWNVLFYNVSGFSIQGGSFFVGVESDIKDESCYYSPIMKFGIEASPGLMLPNAFILSNPPPLPSLVDKFNLVLDYRIPGIDKCDGAASYHRILNKPLGEFRVDF